MGRSNTGKKQEEAALTRNNSLQDVDRAKREQEAGASTTAIQGLAANPGYTQPQLQAQNAEQGMLIHSIYGSAGDEATRHAAITGNANDTGLTPALEQMARERAMQVASGKVGIMGRDADAAMATRRAIPEMYSGLAGIYNGSAGGVTGANASLINQRQQIDAQPTFLQQAALAGIQATGAAATGNLGKK